MNLQDLMSKLKSIEENAMPPLAPTHDNAPATAECGMPVAIGGPASAPHQQDSVTMNVSMNGSGPGGIGDLMRILRNIEDSENKDPHQHDVSKLFGEPGAEPEEPIMGDIVAKLAHEESAGEESPMTHEYEVGETIGDDEETWGNSADGASGHHTHGVDAVTFSGDDMNSKGKSSPLQRVPGSNTLREPTNVSEDLVTRLTSMYETIKGAPIAEASDNKTMSRAAKGNEKYGKDGMQALAKAGREGKDLDKVRDKYDKYDEASHQEKTTMKHVKNPTDAEKKAAKDIKPGIAGYNDRVDMLKSAEKDGRLDESVSQMLALNKRLNG